MSTRRNRNQRSRKNRNQSNRQRNRRGGFLGPLFGKTEFDNKMNCKLYWHPSTTFNPTATSECDKNYPGTGIPMYKFINYPGALKKTSGLRPTYKMNKHPHSAGKIAEIY